MRNIYIFCFIVFSINLTSAQCIPDAVNELIWQNPDDLFYGFSLDTDTSDIDTAIFILGQETSISFQVAWPLKGASVNIMSPPVNITEIRDLTIPNLPQSLSFFLDSATQDTNNIYYPNHYRYGTINLCGAIFDTLGVIELDLNMIHCASVSGIHSCSNTNFPLYIKVIPIQEAFSISPLYGCGNTNFIFEVLNPILPASDYSWSLNGNTYTGFSFSENVNQNTAVSLTYGSNTFWDTARVFNEPYTAIPGNQNIVICQNDSTIISVDAPNLNIQWYRNNIEIINENNDSLKVKQTGQYYAKIWENNNPCISYSTTKFVSIESLIKPIIFENNNDQLEVLNPNNYAVQWYADNILIPSATNNTIDISQFPDSYSCTFTSLNLCTSVSEAYNVCFPGTVNSNISILTLQENIIFTASNFKHDDKTEIAWAFSSFNDGPITTQAQIQQAANNGLVYESTSPNTLEISCNDFDFNDGQYYATAFLNKSKQDSLFFNANDSSCVPNMSFDMHFSAGNWDLCGVEMIYPNGIVINWLSPPNQPCVSSNLIINALGGVISDINPLLMNDFINPNGTYILRFESAGNDTFTITIPAYTITLYADSCNNSFTEDQVIYIDSQSVTLAPNSTDSISFTIPPVFYLPDFVSNCSEIGSSYLFEKSCNVAIEKLINNEIFDLYPNPSQGTLELILKANTTDKIKYKVLNNIGKTVYENTTNKSTTSINLPETLTNGMYIFQIENENKTSQKKFVLNR